MKQLFYFLIITCFANFNAFSQDTITKVNGTKLICKIQREDSTSVYMTIERRGQKIDTYMPKKDIASIVYAKIEPKIEDATENVSIGFGLGMDFGGFGLNLTAYPQRNIGLFAGAGYNILGLGFNFGTKLRIVSEHQTTKVIPYGLAMYGYNAVIKISNAQDLNKTFYGFTLGFGLDFKSSPSKKGYWTLALLVPIRGSEVDAYIDDLKKNHRVEFKNDLSPIGISVGYRLVLD